MAKGKIDKNWKKHVQDWQKSGKKSAIWCRENNIPFTTFSGWKKRLKIRSKNTSASAKPKFIEIKEASLNVPCFQDSGIILEFEGVKIHLKSAFDKDTLKKCLHCLRGISC